MKCDWCDEEILEGERADLRSGNFHRECLLRTVVGSVGHQKRTCSCYGGTESDPQDMTPREAARAAVKLFGQFKNFEAWCLENATKKKNNEHHE